MSNSGHRIPNSHLVPQDEPARDRILIELHRMQLAGVELDDRAVEIASLIGQYAHRKAISNAMVALGDVPRSQKTATELDDRPRWVYYIRRGLLIKIGTTVNLETRFITLRPNEILAIEPGDERVERQRHQQFADLRHSGEYFHPGPALQEHVLALRAEHGAPRVKAPLLVDGQDFFPDAQGVA